MSKEKPKTKEIYRHYKGHVYEVIGTGGVQRLFHMDTVKQDLPIVEMWKGTMEENLEKCIVLQDIGGKVYIFPETDETAEKYKDVEFVAYISDSKIIWVRSVESWNNPVIEEGKETFNRFSLWSA